MSANALREKSLEETEAHASLAAPGTLNGDLYALNVTYLNLMRRFALERRDDCLIRFALTEEEVDTFAHLSFEDIAAMASPYVLQVGLRRELAPLTGGDASSMRMFVAGLIERRRGSDRRKQDMPFVGADRRGGARRDEELES